MDAPYGGPPWVSLIVSCSVGVDAGWIGVKLIAEFLYQMQVLGFSIPKEVTYGVIVGVFLLSLLSRRRTPEEPEP
jgi:hypothetical protein